MCLYPTLMKNPRYKANKKNGGVVPAVSDIRKLYIPIGCGKCIECKKRKTREWQVRLTEDIKHHKNGHFVTLTFSTESLYKLKKEIDQELTGYGIDNGIATKAMRMFLERWRKHNKKSLRHWAVTELGSGEWQHMHIHAIVFTDKPDEIKDRWQYGYVATRKYVSEKTINYIVKYMKKVDAMHKTYEPKIYCSPGIGGKYLETHNARINEYNKNGTNELYTNSNGYKLPLPTYYRNKIYKEDEREKLWVEKLDKNERYVMGQKIDVKGGDVKDEYRTAVKAAQKINKRLGYGEKEEWSQKEYENTIRDKLYKDRLKELELYNEMEQWEKIINSE